MTYTDPWRSRSPGEVLWGEARREDDLRSLDIRIVRMTENDVERGGRAWRPASGTCSPSPDLPGDASPPSPVHEVADA